YPTNLAHHVQSVHGTNLTKAQLASTLRALAEYHQRHTLLPSHRVLLASNSQHRVLLILARRIIPKNSERGTRGATPMGTATWAPGQQRPYRM
ncbi:MAG: hypothetical protein GY809_24270, partial [Planctomycetes bacterium]|nr:hypothetical protein [Planctomycetota bacterium]